MFSIQTVHPHQKYVKLDGEVSGSHQGLGMTLQGYYSHQCAVLAVVLRFACVLTLLLLQIFEARYEKCMRNQSRTVYCMDERMETAQVSIAM